MKKIVYIILMLIILVLLTVINLSKYLNAKTKYGKDGILWAANSEKSANKMMRLLNNACRKNDVALHKIDKKRKKCYNYIYFNRKGKSV